ncbi:xanthine dehydrogenase family protein molybdopterin-binding subunit [Thiocystis violacea]|uniref:xanthine dehydrogenase family protein molybdopterin-binding subunit n=1 Tax=Thiocystis violacea TaxID=13725 RepID=UPI001904C4EB|nr:molybdopterin cofactor-binding domain-containing protein [Thiocystis violacea]MBK1720941.1 aldehyde oxidase [Thiocystis violacea]
MADAGVGRRLSRRSLLKIGALAGGGLALGIHLPVRAELDPEPRSADAKTAPEAPVELAPNAWVRIHGDGRIELVLARSEMGQGVMTALPMLLAEELEVGLDQVQLVIAPVARVYANRLLGVQATGESTSVRDAWTPLREAGAAARALMIAAAASVWEALPSDCQARRGRVHHSDGVRSLSYGELVATASGLAPPDRVALKSPAAWTLIGTSQQRLDTPEKVSGGAHFGLDIRLPGLLFATLYRCPVPGSRVLSWRAAETLKVAGVVDVLAVRNGIGVVAESTWAALQGRARLDVSCRPTVNANLDSQRIRSRLRIGLKGRSAVARKSGDVSLALAAAAHEIEAVYEVGFQPHACMEPMNCTADVQPDRCALYVPTQAQEGARAIASAITGLAPGRISVHTSLLGGGDGRRLEQDFVVDALELSLRVHRPVQVVWTREDDFRHDFFRPMTLHRLRGGLDAEGRVTAWFHRVVGPSVLARLRPDSIRDGIDPFMVEGAADIAYEIPDLRIEYRRADTPAAVGLWRGGGYAHTSFAAECFLDELAAAAGQDPLMMRRHLLAGSPRHLRLLDRIGERAGWGAAATQGLGRGLALVAAFESLIAMVAEVALEGGRVRVHRVFCVVDCGRVVNPDLVRGQIQGGVAYGLTAALKGEISFTDGQVDQLDFEQYPLLRFGEMPEVVIDILPSDADPGGVSGLGVPPIAPAVANAVFALTGERVRSLPIRLAS